MLTKLKLLLVALSLFALVGCGAPKPGEATDGAKPVAATNIELNITADAPAAPRVVEIPLGSKVTLKVSAYKEEKVHVHGYEVLIPVAVGKTSEASFDAKMSGTYEVETHEPANVWLKLVVK